MLSIPYVTTLAVCLLAPPEPSKPDAQRMLQLVVSAYNSASSKELYPLCGKTFQKALPAPQLDAVFRQSRNKYGVIPDQPVHFKMVAGWHSYRAKAARIPVVLRLAQDSAGLLVGMQILPEFLAEIPSGRLTLEQVQSRLTDAVGQTLVGYRLPSISFALVRQDRIVWAAALGYQNVARSVAADTDTAYVTGSMIKVLIATALMQFVDEGKLELDAPVNRFLKNFQVPNPFEKDAPLTIRHLLSHHGGVPNGAEMVPLWRREVPASLEDVVRKRVRVTRKPGESFGYSNYGYTLNGYLVGELAGMPVERALKKRLFEPLHMTHTAITPTPEIAENLAMPYEPSSDGKGVVPGERVRLDVFPAGDVYSTPTDIARFLLLHLNEGRIDGKQVVSAKSIAEMAKPQFAKKGDPLTVGLGWMIETGKRRLLWHNGAVPGFYTYMAAAPEQRLGVVLFTNKFLPLEAALGLGGDPLIDLSHLAIELLDRLQPDETKTSNNAAKPHKT